MYQKHFYFSPIIRLISFFYVMKNHTLSLVTHIFAFDNDFCRIFCFFFWMNLLSKETNSKEVDTMIEHKKQKIIVCETGKYNTKIIYKKIEDRSIENCKWDRWWSNEQELNEWVFENRILFSFFHFHTENLFSTLKLHVIAICIHASLSYYFIIQSIRVL